MEKAKSFEIILTNLNILRYIIVSKVKNGLYDVNKRSEDFFKGLLNIVYDWDLENMNIETLTYPGIDLGSKKDRIAIQVTSQTSRVKTETTINLFDSNGYNKDYDRLIMFNITTKANHSKDFTSSTITFDKDKDMLDVDDILTYIERNVDTPKMKMVEDYILQEIPYYTTKLTNKSDLLHSRADYKYIQAKNYGKISDFLVQNGAEAYLEDFKAQADSIFEKLSGLSQNERIGLIPILTKGKSNLEVLVNTWGSTLNNSFGFDDYKIRQIGNAIEDAGLAYNDEDEFKPKFMFSQKDKEFWLDVVGILNADELFDFVVNMNFSLLDN